MREWRSARQSAGHTARRWWRRGHHSVRMRLLVLFLLLALAMMAVFLWGIGHAFSSGWRGTGQSLIDDYADRLVADIGSPPNIERARALAAHLPIVVRIDGPQVHWQSSPPARHGPPWARADDARRAVVRETEDGHRVELSLDARPDQSGPARIAWLTLGALLVLTALAYGAIHRMLHPVRAIGEGVRRFGQGQFDQPIRVPHRRHPDELSDLAMTVNQMATDIGQMLDAKRGLLLAISHELRSPLTRARLNAELLPDAADTQTQRAALLRDLSLMRELITDLLESERLASPHAALLREPTDLAALAREVIDQLANAQPRVGRTEVVVDPDFPPAAEVDAARCRLLLRNILDNAWRHTPADAPPPQLRLSASAPGVVAIDLRDHGHGVPEAQRQRLSEAFYRPDSARQRASGGVGLGLYLARLVAQAHGGRISFGDASPGLVVRVELPTADA